MTGIGVIADSHANLPATRAALDALEGMECDEVIHVGDAVGIGPHPAEAVSLLTDRGVRCVMGNHDEIAAFGLPKPLPPWMSEGEAEHQRWTHNQLTQAQLEAVRSWPMSCQSDAVKPPWCSSITHGRQTELSTMSPTPPPTTSGV